MEYNVTAVEQTDPNLGDGPAYLLSGVSNTGYWYQVGVSWNWAPGQDPGTGFDMTYEVFDTTGTSVFPTGGQGGLQAFSGPVNAGDLILLNLYFTSQNVMMLAEDTNTGATTSDVYSNMGATYFIGLPDSVSNSNGFFTGLMTEWYHGGPFFSDEKEVIYSNPTYGLSSAWMWMDEFNSNSLTGVFSANTSAPVPFTDPTKLQEFTFNGTTEYSDAYEFITGALTNATQPTSSRVPLTLSFKVNGGPTGYSPPEFTYVSNGSRDSVPLTESPTVYQVDVGTDWTVSPQLNGSTSSERWETEQPTVGLANSSRIMQFSYYTQYYLTFGFSISGGGSGFSPPKIAYTSFGSVKAASVDVGVWADAGSKYQYPSVLAGSTPGERWFEMLSGSIGSSAWINATYYHQYLVTINISFRNTDLFPGVPLISTFDGRPFSGTVVLGTNEEWLDSGSQYSLKQSLSLANGDRLMTNGTRLGIVSAGLVVNLTYARQFYVAVTLNAVDGGNLSVSSGWYDSGSRLLIDAKANDNWKFESWQGVGTSSVSTLNASFYITVGPYAPANETATFYPAVTIHAVGPMSVSYSDGSVSGTVSAGAETEVYVPPLSTLSLTASSLAFLETFQGWRGANNSSDTSTSVLIEGPESITSNSQYYYQGIGIVSMVLVIAAIAGTLGLRARRLKSTTPVLPRKTETNSS